MSSSSGRVTTRAVVFRLTAGSEDVRAPRGHVGREHGVGPADGSCGPFLDPARTGQRPDRYGPEVGAGQRAYVEDQVGLGVGSPARGPVPAALQPPPALVPVAEGVADLQ